MQGRAFFRTGDLVAHFDADGIAPINFDGWGWEFSVYEKDAPVDAIRLDVASSNIELVGVCLSTSWGCRIRVGICNSGSPPREAVWQIRSGYKCRKSRRLESAQVGIAVGCGLGKCRYQRAKSQDAVYDGRGSHCVVVKGW